MLFGKSNAGDACHRHFFSERLSTLVDGVLQTLASLELRLFRCRNIDFFTGTRVATFRSCTRSNGEGTEADETNFVTAFECIGNGIENRVNGLCSVSFRQISFSGDTSNEIVFVHFLAPLLDVRSYKEIWFAPNLLHGQCKQVANTQSIGETQFSAVLMLFLQFFRLYTQSGLHLHRFWT